MPASNGNGVHEIAVLARPNATLNTPTEIRDSKTGTVKKSDLTITVVLGLVNPVVAMYLK
jgi:hypothetical protein